MKTGILFIGFIFFLFGFGYHATAQVGIGTNTPLARLHVTDSSVLFSAEGTVPASAQGQAPVSGPGRRMMWYSDKGAFRAGFVSDIQWHTDNIGVFSMAFGANTKASGNISTALGNGSIASGGSSTAMGQRTTASGDVSTAMGQQATASGSVSTAMGQQTTASGGSSTAMGVSATAQSYCSVALGRYNAFSGTSDQWVPTDPLLVAGNGSNNATRSNALVLYKNGDLWIAGTLEQASDARLKKNILPLNGALSLIQQLSGYHYNWNAASYSNELQTGVLAQEVQQAMPELVRENAEGQLSVNYSGLIPYLIEAIKEQQQMIEKQQAELKELKDRILLHP